MKQASIQVKLRKRIIGEKLKLVPIMEMPTNNS